jgi:hypothetical protein
MQHGDVTAALKRQIAKARRALLVERVVEAALYPIVAAGLWAAFGLAGGLAALPPLGASLAVIAALVGLVAIAWRALVRFAAPTDADARARLERDARLDPGALDALEDQPSRLDPTALAFWRAAQAKARKTAAEAQAQPARPRFRAVDPWFARIWAPVALVLALIAAGLNAPDRLAQTFLPDPGPLLGDKAITIEAWAAPAAYTGAAPVPLSDRIGAITPTPPSVEATVRVAGPVGAPRLLFFGRSGRREAPFVRGADGVWEAKLAIPEAGALVVKRFHTKARWRLRPGQDAVPSIRFTTPPTLKGDQVLFSWTGADDFGVRSVFLAIRPTDPPAGLVDAPPVLTPLDAPAGEPRAAEDDVDIDLTPHPYAGMAVELSLVARDALGQEGRSEPAQLTLPEPVFLQPLARAAIEIRRKILHERRAFAAAASEARRGAPATLAMPDPLFGSVELAVRTDDQSPRIERAPEGIRQAARYIDGLTSRPDDGYFIDAAVFAGFKAARAALSVAGDAQETVVAADILWETAQRAEHGDSADARRALDRARQALAEAIARGAPPNEIERLSEVMRQATQDYLQALREEAIREGREATQEDTQQQTTLTQSDIDEMLKEVERLANEGRQAEAQALLDQIAGMMDNLEMQLVRGPSSGEGGEQQQQMNEQLGELSDTIGSQRALRDETQREAQGEGSASPDQLADRQERLRRDLEEAREGMEGRQGEGEGGQGEGARDAGEQLGAAGEAMQRAEEALRRGDLEGAQAAQDEALRAMRAGAEALSKEMMRMEADNGEDPAGGRRDPLGRRVGSIGGPGEDVGVPEEIQRERAREILDELRRRAQDPRRPEAERDYLRRLLDRFAGS